MRVFFFFSGGGGCGEWGWGWKRRGMKKGGDAEYVAICGCVWFYHDFFFFSRAKYAWICLNVAVSVSDLNNHLVSISSSVT